jgi:hypothetical protein
MYQSGEHSLFIGRVVVGVGMMMEAVRTSETSVDNHFTWQYNPEDNSEHQKIKLTFLHKGDLNPVS